MSRIHTLFQENKRFSPPPGQERWLTGYVDASFKQKPPQKGAGWGCWVRDSHTRVLRAGPCPDWVQSSDDAELCALYSGVYTALTRLQADQANIMIIKTDNQSVARWFGWGRFRSRGTPEGGKRGELIEKTLVHANEKQVRLVVVWVKGHRGAVDTSAYLNTQVDQMAGEARKTQTTWLEIQPIWHTKP